MKRLIKIAAFLLALQILPAHAAERNTAQVLSPANTVLQIFKRTRDSSFACPEPLRPCSLRTHGLPTSRCGPLA